MTRIFGSPSRYVQGRGAIGQLGTLTQRHSRRPMIICDADVFPFVDDDLKRAFAGRDALFLKFSGEVTHAAIGELAKQGGNHKGDLIIGIGGGKGLDAAKGAALKMDLPFVMVPSIASNDAPTGRALAVYDDNHTMVAVETIEDSPLIVVADTQLIANAPPHFLLAGMGDALAKKFEAERAQADGSNNFFGTRPLLTALAIADTCYQTLRSYGVAAMDAAKRHEADEAFEAVVEANILMSGLGWESSGLSYAHAVVRGLVKARGASKAAHGMQVGYTTLVQLAIEGRDDDFILDLIGFNRSIGLPTQLGDLGMDGPSAEEIDEIARLTMIGPPGGVIQIKVTQQHIADAIRRVEALSA